MNSMIAKRALLVAMVLGLGACNDTLTEANVNPNAPTYPRGRR